MQDETTVYEVGFHLNPNLPEGEVLGKVTDLKSQISLRGGTFISEGFPALRPLEYTIKKRIINDNKRFNQAYFGWLKFEMSPSEIVELKKTLEIDNDVVRFLIIKTIKEDTMLSNKPEFKFFGEEVEEEKKDDNSKEEVKEELTAEEEAEIDKSIDELISEDKKD